MAKTIGVIDHYLDNWHANNLPKWLSDECGDAYRIAYAWGSLDPRPGDVPAGREASRSSAQWCAEHGIQLCENAAQVVRQSDVLLVLAPNNPETHEALCREALASGKPTYVDKTFAPDLAAARRLFDAARAGGTPMFSSSSLRFASQLRDLPRAGLRQISARGGGTYQIYSIHQIEMIVTLFGPDVRRIMSTGSPQAPALLLEFGDGRFAHFGHYDCPFGMALAWDDGTKQVIPEFTDFFPNFVHELVDFFETGVPKAPEAETLAVAAIREAGFAALEQPGQWFPCGI